MVEADIMDLRTGGNLWRLLLDGVAPCSINLVKGGGNLVTLSVQYDHEARYIYHVVHEKRIKLQGDLFRLRAGRANHGRRNRDSLALKERKHG
jgi:hypothetical protein